MNAYVCTASASQRGFGSSGAEMNRMVVSHPVGTGSWILSLCNSSNCLWPLCHLSCVFNFINIHITFVCFLLNNHPPFLSFFGIFYFSVLPLSFFYHAALLSLHLFKNIFTTFRISYNLFLLYLPQTSPFNSSLIHPHLPKPPTLCPIWYFFYLKTHKIKFVFHILLCIRPSTDMWPTYQKLP